jgi:hypothetical protein
VFWTGVNNHLYMRDLTHGQTTVPGGEAVAGETVQLDVPQPGATGQGNVEPEFEDASPDGSRVWFTDKQQLSEDSSVSGRDLYECEIVEAAGGKLECQLHDLTPETTREESAEVRGVLGTSEEGCDAGSDGECDVYFVADGKYTANAVSGACEGEVAGRSCNLYVDRDGTIGLVAVLASEDESDWGHAFPSELEFMSSRVSPDGGWVAFMSDRDLTGYDPDDAVSGHPDEEAYLYDAATDRLVCASCDPSGARPVGIKWKNALEVAPPIFSGTGEGEFAFTLPNEWISGLLSSWEAYESAHARYQPRYLSDEGRLFFDSDDALVPKDINGTWDVYEYEPEKVPSGSPDACSSSSASGGVVFKPAHHFKATAEGGALASEGEEGAGCVGLISSGTSPQESAFMDASESGGDVFFLTKAKLSPSAIEDSYAVYDAHECTGSSPCIPPAASSPAECVTAEACRAAPSPEPAIYGAPSSATFNGQGNLTPPAPASKPASKPKALTRAQRLKSALAACRKKAHRKAKRRICEASARRTYGKKTKSKSHKRSK